jgi:hypothetical protein
MNFIFLDLHYEKLLHIGLAYVVDRRSALLGTVPDLVNFMCNSISMMLANGGEGRVLKSGK